MKKSLQIGVIGSAGAEEYPNSKSNESKNLLLAQKIGALLAKNNCLVVTGGKGGIMEAAAQGAKNVGGRTIGIISGNKRLASNNFTDIEVLSGSSVPGLDEFILVMMSDALIVIGGGAGTLEEVTIAYRNKKPIVALKNTGGWADRIADTFLDERKTVKIKETKTAEQAVLKAISLAQKNLHPCPL
jgi:uncharacterized protein (TIGR00725 family)